MGSVVVHSLQELGVALQAYEMKVRALRGRALLALSAEIFTTGSWAKRRIAHFTPEHTGATAKAWTIKKFKHRKEFGIRIVNLRRRRGLRGLGALAAILEKGRGPVRAKRSKLLRFKITRQRPGGLPVGTVLYRKKVGPAPAFDMIKKTKPETVTRLKRGMYRIAVMLARSL